MLNMENMEYVIKFCFDQLKKPVKKLFKKKAVQKFSKFILWMHMLFLATLYAAELFLIPYQRVLQSLSLKPEHISLIHFVIISVIALCIQSYNYKKRGKSVRQANENFICCNIAGFSSALLSKLILDYQFLGKEVHMFYPIIAIFLFMCSIEYLSLNQKDKPASC